MPEIVGSFTSLGNNCEFGLVQRACGVEPLGLFRFSRTELALLIAALDTDFELFGSPGDLEIYPDGQGRPSCRSRRYGFDYLISDLPADQDAAKFLKRETAKVGFLKRKLLEDLGEDDRIFVRKAAADETDDDARRLLQSLRRHGRSTFVHVRQGNAVTATAAEDGLIRATLPHLAPIEAAYDIDLESWLDLCARIHRLVRKGPADSLAAPKRINLLARSGRRPSTDVVEAGRTEPQVFGAYQEAAQLDPSTIYTYSAWLWVPSDFQGDRIGAAIGHYRLGWRDADLTRRDCWQRVWVSARIPEGFRTLMMGIVVSGPPGSRVWSRDRWLEVGLVPGAAEPPRCTP
ncbi:hypothetical protein [Methylobacterium haplocladii]|nr:hypothetical protein [Methylobacterium haplocladii]